MHNVAQTPPDAGGPSQARLVPTRSRSERADPDLLARLVSCLHGRGWVHRRELRRELGLSDDSLRALARYSVGEVVGSSAKGYALTREAPVEDVHRVIAEMLSRSKELRARVAEVFRVLHGRPGAKHWSNTGVAPDSDGLGGVA